MLMCSNAIMLLEIVFVELCRHSANYYAKWFRLDSQTHFVQLSANVMSLWGDSHKLKHFVTCGLLVVPGLVMDHFGREKGTYQSSTAEGVSR